MPSRILVIGAGATGGYFGGRLAQAGRDVTFLARPAAAERLRAGGLVIRDADDEARLDVSVLPPADLAGDVEAHGRYDVVLVTVKSAGLAWARDALAPDLLSDGAAVVPLLNGLAQIDVFSDALGPERVLGGTMRIVTSLAADGAVVLHQPITTITLGELDGGPSERTERLRELLEVPGVDVVVSPDTQTELWNKWYFIVACGVLGVLARGTVGEIAATPGGTDLAHRVIAEAAAVAGAAGSPVTETDLARTTAFLTAPGSGFVSSLYRDVVAGRAGESEHIVGDFARRAASHGVPTPLCDVALLQMRVVTAPRG